MASEKHAKGEKGQATLDQMRYLVTSIDAFGPDLRADRCTPVSPLKLKRNTGMSIMNQPPINPAPRSSTRGTLQLTRDEVRMLHYYRALSNDDCRRCAACSMRCRCLSRSWPVTRPRARAHPQLATPVQGASQDNGLLPQSNYSQEPLRPERNGACLAGGNLRRSFMIG